MENVLLTDRKFRYPGVTSDLFDERNIDITPDPELDQCFLVKRGAFRTNNDGPYRPVAQPEQWVESIRHNIRGCAPFLRRLDYHHYVLAGGAISRLLSQRAQTKAASDFDIFMYDIAQCDADHEVTRIIRTIGAEPARLLSVRKSANVVSIKLWYPDPKRDDSDDSDDSDSDDGDDGDGDIVHTTRPFDINVGGFSRALTRWFSGTIYEVQIILRIYSSISEILHGFDLGSSAIAYDGAHVYMTSLGQYSYANSVNIVDPSRRSTTYESRLYKYLLRGFYIAMPHMNVLRAALGSDIRLPNCKLTYTRAGAFDARTGQYSKVWVMHDTFNRKSDYDATGAFSISVLNECPEVAPPPYIITDVASIAWMLRRQRDKFIAGYEDGTLSVDAVIKYFGKQMGIDYICKNQAFTTFVKALKQRDLYEVARSYQVKAQETFFPLTWRVTDPGTQLTSSINPIIEDPVEWYGRWYTPTPYWLRVTSDLDARKCVVCMERPCCRKALVPCGHAQFCDDCIGASKQGTCPLCRSLITDTIKVYY